MTGITRNLHYNEPNLRLAAILIKLEVAGVQLKQMTHLTYLLNGAKFAHVIRLANVGSSVEYLKLVPLKLSDERWTDIFKGEFGKI